MKKQDTSRTTMLVISTGFIVIYFIFKADWALYVSLAVGLTGIISGFLSRMIEILWMKLAKVLSYIVPSILLSLVFYLILFPVALLWRLFTKDPLMLKSNYKSFFIDINKDFEKKSFEKIW